MSSDHELRACDLRVRSDSNKKYSVESVFIFRTSGVRQVPDSEVDSGSVLTKQNDAERPKRNREADTLG